MPALAGADPCQTGWVAPVALMAFSCAERQTPTVSRHVSLNPSVILIGPLLFPLSGTAELPFNHSHLLTAFVCVCVCVCVFVCVRVCARTICFQSCLYATPV